MSLFLSNVLLIDQEASLDPPKAAIDWHKNLETSRMYISSNFRFEDECRSNDIHLNVWIKGQPRILLGAYLERENLGCTRGRHMGPSTHKMGGLNDIKI